MVEGCSITENIVIHVCIYLFSFNLAINTLLSIDRYPVNKEYNSSEIYLVYTKHGIS